MRDQPKDSRPTFDGLFLVAGHPALDLVNTVKYRGQSDPQDRLTDFGAVVAWAHVAGLIDSGQAAMLAQEEGARVWSKVLALRESLWVLMNADWVSQKALTGARKTIETAISGLRYRAEIDPQTGVLQKVIALNGPRDLLARITDAIADLLTRRGDFLIKTCDGCDCDWLFIDHTKARRRRWCDSRTCGNQARVRTYREKHQTTEQNHAG